MKRKHPEQLVPPSSSSHDSNEMSVDCSHITRGQNRSDRYSDNSSRKKCLTTYDMEPLRLSDRKVLKEFVRALDSRYEMPSRNILSNKLLPRMYNRMKVQLMELLTKVQNVAITTDMWTSSSNQAIALAVDGHHDVDNLSSVIAAVLDQWKLREKVTAIVTDNAAVMLKVAEIIKLRHLPCFAHTLNLVYKDACNQPGLKEIIDKCKQIVRYFKHSTLASDQLKDAQKSLNKPELKLLQEVETRWNSLFYMLERLRNVREEVTLVINQNSRAPPNLSAEEYTLLEEIEKILDPLEACTIAISGEMYPTISLIIPLIKGLSLEIAKLEKEILSDFSKNFIQLIKDSINKRLKSYEIRSPCMIATMLNPHFKKLGFKTVSDCERAIAAIQREHSSYLRSSSTVDAIVDIRQYVEKPIIPNTEFPIEYWNHSENSLKVIALKYLCIPATSTPAERIFSKAGLIMTDRRSRLSSEHLNELLFINQNASLFE
ncbi:unnamed protein product [Euphydryas editha]|uniref:HAT C-terminal dimerisation domain-containing protein n=1 Tax=Euphydryas editha TaxID=104508 RepID=A0AAU9TWC2_EUPED|nr:unnamed protein product [Euphydryas editha]